MKTYILIVFSGFWGFIFCQDSSELDLLNKELFNDSLQIFLRYQSEIKDLQATADYDSTKWNLRAQHDHVVTCAMVKKLKDYNHAPYNPIDSFVREGFTTAYAYPAPSQLVRKTVFADNTRRFRFVVYDHTTRFICDKERKTRIPYVLRIIYENGLIVEEKKLNPISLTPIE